MKKLFGLIALTYSLCLHAAGLDPFQQELKKRLGESKPVPAAQPPQAPKPVLKPKTQAELKEQEYKKYGQLHDNLWGTKLDAKQVWDQIKALLHKHNVPWEDWQEAEYEQLGELRDVEADKVSKNLANILDPYLVVWGELSRILRDRLVILMDISASAFFGDAKLSSKDYEALKEIIENIKKLSPEKTVRLISLLAKIADEKKPELSETKKEAACMRALQKKHYDELEQQRQTLMNLFYERTGFNEKNFNEYMQNSRARIYAFTKGRAQKTGISPCPSTVKFYQKAQELFPKLGIDPTQITILKSEVETDEMEASISYLLFNPVYCFQIPDAMLEVILLHECFHIVFEDALIRIAMQEIFDAKAPHEKESYMQLWNFFKEKRADIYAYFSEASNIPPRERIQADIEYYKAHPVGEGERHQSAAQRTAIAELIYKEMQACYK